jgi:hypothetical protein
MRLAATALAGASLSAGALATTALTGAAFAAAALAGALVTGAVTVLLVTMATPQVVDDIIIGKQYTGQFDQGHDRG